MYSICIKCGLNKPVSEFSRSRKTHRTDCKNCVNTYCKIWRKKNPEYHREYNKKWSSKNRERINLKVAERCNKAYKENINYRLITILRKRLLIALKHNQKRGSAVKDLGCTIEEFKVYLESKFQPGMNWSNQGKWHIDHIIPLSKVDLTNYEEFKKATNYTNLQPLWAIDNIKKSNKI